MSHVPSHWDSLVDLRILRIRPVVVLLPVGQVTIMGNSLD